MHDEKEISRQINVAYNQRNAARDYFEINLIPSIKYFLATNPENELDSLASMNETLFKYRFGVNVNHRLRAKIIALKNEHLLSAQQTCTLIKSGQIRCLGQDVLIAPDKISPLVGMIFIGLHSIPALLIMLNLVASDIPFSASSLIIVLMLAGFWLFTAYLIKIHMISPWRILKNSGLLQKLPNVGLMDSLLLHKYPINR